MLSLRGSPRDAQCTCNSRIMGTFSCSLFTKEHLLKPNTGCLLYGFPRKQVLASEQHSIDHELVTILE